jgi:hypothetical protein
MKSSNDQVTGPRNPQGFCDKVMWVPGGAKVRRGETGDVGSKVPRLTATRQWAPR